MKIVNNSNRVAAKLSLANLGEATLAPQPFYIYNLENKTDKPDAETLLE